MKLYIATPINARKEKDLLEKLRAARHRVELLKELLEEDERFVDYDMISTFDLPHGANLPEEAAISSCVFAVLTSDAIYLDLITRLSLTLYVTVWLSTISGDIPLSLHYYLTPISYNYELTTQ